MDIFVLLQLAVMIIGVQSFKINSKRAELYFSKDQCVSLRGFFALFVIFHHISLETQGGIVFPYFKYIGVLGTTGFFFISGYGLTKQLNKKKKQYLKSFIPHRVGSILIPYLIMTGFYFAYRYKTEDYTIKKLKLPTQKSLIDPDKI